MLIFYVFLQWHLEHSLYWTLYRVAGLYGRSRQFEIIVRERKCRQQKDLLIAYHDAIK